MKETVGIQMYTLRKSMTEPEGYDSALRRVSEMGYDTVQVRPPEFWDAGELGRRLRGYGLQADSAFLPVYEIPERIGEGVEQARAFGTDVLRTDSINNVQRRSAEGFRAFAEHLNRCGAALKKEGIRLMYHFHSFEYIKLGDETGMDILLGETDPELVLFQPDVFWLISAGKEPSVELRRFRGRAIYAHFKDYFITQGKDAALEVTTSASGPVGVGNLNWKGILKACRDIGIYNFVAEDDIGEVYDPFESAAISCRNLKKLLGTSPF